MTFYCIRLREKTFFVNMKMNIIIHIGNTEVLKRAQFNWMQLVVVVN